MSIQSEKIEKLVRRREAAALGGGRKRIDAQHQKGKLTARERLALLLDEGSFEEFDTFVQHRCTNFGMDATHFDGDGVVTGQGTIGGRLVFVYAQDFTVSGGSLSKTMSEKICKVMDMAMQCGAPFIGINDSGGARIQEGIDSLAGYGEIFERNILSSGVVPQISAIMGPCAGGAVYSPALTDFTLMVKDTSYMFLTGPAVVKQVLGEDVTQETLGGASVHASKSGVAHFKASTEEDAIAVIRDLLSYLPQNNMEEAPRKECDDPVDRMDDSLNEIIPEDPNQAYDMYQVIARLFDGSEFMEYHKGYGPEMITGIAKVDGLLVGVVANVQGFFPKYPEYKYEAGQTNVIGAGGKLYRQGLIKMNDFVTLCARDRLPMVWIQDTTGIDVGNDAERAELLGLGQSLIYSIQSSGLPMMEITLRRGTAAAHYVLGGPQGNDTNAFSLGTAATEIDVMNGETAAAAMFTSKLAKEDKAGNDLQPTIDRMNALIQDYVEKSKPAYCAKLGLVDEVVDMTMLRNYIWAFADSCYQNPESICPFHQMLLPRIIRDYNNGHK